MFSIRFVRRYLLHFTIAAGVLLPAPASAQVAQERQFFTNLLNACNASTDPTFLAVCGNTFTGGLAGGYTTPGAGTANVGSTASYGGAGQAALQRQREAESGLGDDEKKKRKKLGGGSGDFSAGAWGGFVTAQNSHTTRALTDLENGYKAKIDGFLVGLDRRSGNDLVTGFSVGRTDTDNTYDGNAGAMSARNTTLMIYGTYLPAPGAYLGAYAGGGKGTQDATRRISAGLITGTASSSSDSRQTTAGLSGGYEWYSGGLTVGLNAATDYVKNRTDGTTEKGTTGLEFIYPDQTTTSLTGSLGTRASYRTAFSWGAIVPSIRASYIHEFRDNARTISPRLVVSPTTVLPYTTDEPDRSYYIGGAGATVEFGRGTQVFVDYEKRGGHRFIETWAASVGLIQEF
jgi:uncharacterized protein YhjY with autotransporter beta-barrel domain